MIQPDIARALAALPVSLDPRYSIATKALYAPRLADAQEGVTAMLDLAYGPHPRQTLDVYSVAGTKPSATVIYVPGGGYTGGDKRADNVMFGNIGSYFARRGMLGITMNYRLAPEVSWPAGAQDVDAAVTWVKANAAAYGADTGRIIVFGHSAGASHAASFLFDPDLRGDTKVTGAVLVSGASYMLRKGKVLGNSRLYFGEDESLYERRSATRHVPGTNVPVMLAVAEFDLDDLVAPTLEIALELNSRDGRCPPLMRLDGHNHFSPPCSLGTSDDVLGGAIVRFIKGLA